ncbi:MAG: hypothetical protein CL793_07375 [Chloroflexi bacterium]|nr:hypothetical protein [Chloroflexota bacterium]
MLIPKARKQGITTLIQALFFERLYNNDHEEAAVVAHNAESSSYIFQISRRFYDFLPQDMQRGLKYSAKTELEYIEPHGSKYMVMTARSGDALAKGTTPTLFHGSEVANWADSGQDPWKAWTSIASSIPDHHETAIILESTANGRDPFFYRMCMGAIKGDNDYEVVFLPWYLNDKYTREITDSGWRITQEEDHIKGEILDTEGYLISDEQFEYRRWCIKNKCGGEVGIWDRYYPATLRDAFAVSEKRFFPEAVKKHYRESVAPPKVVGDMGISEGGYPVFDPNKHGSLHVWEKPISREKYVIAVDVSEGIPGGDYHSAYVLKRSSIEAVAALSCLVDADELVDQLYRLGLWYNKAVIAPENNHNPEVCRRLSYHMRYPNVYWQRDINNPRSKANRPGWNTNVKTRREMLDVLKMVTRQHLLRIYDEGFVEEMEDFAWNVNTRKWQATPGKHDDRIMAMAIGLMLLDLSPYKDRSDRLRPKVEDGFSRYKEFESYWKKHSGSNKKTGRLTFG